MMSERSPVWDPESLVGRESWQIEGVCEETRGDRVFLRWSGRGVNVWGGLGETCSSLDVVVFINVVEWTLKPGLRLQDSRKPSP